MQIDQDFLQQTASLDWETWGRCDDSCYALDVGLRIRAVNQGYLAFAAANGLPDVLQRYPLGTPLSQAFNGLMLEVAVERCLHVLRQQDVAHFDYECSSPTHFRLFRMSLMAIHGGYGLLVNSHRIVETPHEDPVAALGPEHRDALGVIHQCSHCRKVHHQRECERWDWIPSLVAHPDRQISHGLCPHCLDHYYPDVED